MKQYLCLPLAQHAVLYLSCPSQNSLLVGFNTSGGISLIQGKQLNVNTGTFFWLSTSHVLHYINIFHIMAFCLQNEELNLHFVHRWSFHFVYMHQMKQAVIYFMWTKWVWALSFLFLLVFSPVDSVIGTKLHSVDKNVLKCLSVSLTGWLQVRGLTKCILLTEWTEGGMHERKTALQTNRVSNYRSAWFFF